MAVLVMACVVMAVFASAVAYVVMAADFCAVLRLQVFWLGIADGLQMECCAKRVSQSRARSGSRGLLALVSEA